MIVISKTPASLGSVTFRVPLYQRPYAWDPHQVLQLLEDLKEACKNAPECDYHIGILSVARTHDDTSRYDLIDGQQRITTLMLIGKVASIYCDDWRGFLGGNRLDLYGRDKDKEFLNDGTISQNESAFVTGSALGCNRRMVDAVITAKDFFEKRLDGLAPDKFSKYIYGHAAFFLSEVPDGYTLLDKNQQFVRMNNRGKQLEKHEILKVRLLDKIKSEHAGKNALDAWNDMLKCLTGMSGTSGNGENSLKTILEPIGNDPDPGRDQEILYTAMLTVPEFLLIALYRFQHSTPDRFQNSRRGNTGWSFKVDKLLETFASLKDEQNITGFMNLLEKQMQTFKEYFIFLSKQDKYEFLEIAKGNIKTAFGEDTEGLKRLIAVQSFLHVSTEPHHWMIPALDWLQLQQGTIGCDSFADQLEEIDNSLNGGNLDPLKRNLSSIDNLGGMQYGAVSHYWFYRLDYELWKLYPHKYGEIATHGPWANLPPDAKGLIANFRFRRCGSVEHIVPQKVPEGKAHPDPDHSFGNLALISSSRNSKFSNNPPEGKKEIIRQSNYTESLKMLHFLWCDSSHGRTMHDILKEMAQPSRASERTGP